MSKARPTGRELIVQTARWWAFRIELDEHGHGHIRDVIGPDEYHEHVDDNAYTHVMARWNLRRAVDAGAGVVDERERHRWHELAATIADGYDPSTGIYEQFAGFHALEPLLIAQQCLAHARVRLRGASTRGRRARDRPRARTPLGDARAAASVPRQSRARTDPSGRRRGERRPAHTRTEPRRGARRADPNRPDVRAHPVRLKEVPMTTVLAALGSDASAQPVLSAAIALAPVFDATITALHVSENGTPPPKELASAAGIELREVSGCPVEQIVAATQDPDVVARARRARSARRPPTRGPHRARGRHPRCQAGRRRPARGAASEATEAHPGAARRKQRELARARGHDQARSPPALGDARPARPTRHITTPHERVRLVRRLGVPADDVVAVGHETAADLIVLAWNQNLGPGRARVVSETLAHSKVPVLLMPTT
jgi:Glycosyl hydrolase family 65 central catalytic domain